MLLKSIELQGFKSFPDKTLLTFDKGITAVIGPNGSGKSNISDAVRWVLGEQSSKSLRGAKMEDVIFGGTMTRKAMGFAEVSLTIDNSERKLSFDNDMVTVTRRYYRSGESEYQLNHTAVRLKDVHELFMDTGLGRDGYSMIGQGRIDEIVGSKSEERRDIFEEAAGISRFRYRKAEAERRLRQAEENLLRLRDIMEELESRVGPLKEQSERAQEFLTYAGEKRELEIGLWLRTLKDSKERLREEENKLTLASHQYRQIQDELASLARRSEEEGAKAQELMAKIDELRRDAAGAEEETTRLNGEIAVLENTILHQNETIQRLQDDIQRSGQDDQAIDKEMIQKQTEREEVRQRISQKEAEAQGLQERLLSLSEQSESHAGRLRSASEVLSAMAAQMADLRVKAVSAQSTLAELAAQKEALGVRKKEQGEELEAVFREKDEATSLLREIEEKMEACSNALQGYELRLKGRREKAEKAKAELDRLALDIGEKERRIRILKDLEKNMEGYHFSTKTVIQQGKQGTLTGIHGSVLQLVKTDSRYAAAVETALGAAAQNVVVSTEQDAKKAIAHLKSAGAGRATFLPVSVIKGRLLDERGLEDCPGFVGLACALVRYDAKYEQVMRSLLGRVAVAEDMDAAISIARKFGYRFRVVTLDGQVVNAGGSLTGGSLAKNAGLLSRAGDIERLRRQMKELEEERQRQQKEFSELQAELGAAQAETLAASGELSTLGEDKIRVQGELKRLEEQSGRLETGLTVLQKEEETLDERAEETGRQQRDSESALEVLQKQYGEQQGARDQLAAAGDALSGQREALGAQLSACKLEALALQKDLDTLRDFIDGLEQQKANRSERTAALEREIEEIAAGITAEEEQIETLRQTIKAHKERSAAAQEEAKAMSEQRIACEQTSYQLRAEEREKTGGKERLGGELARLEERKAAMLKEYDDIVAKLYDEYELTRSEAEQTGIVIEDPKAAGRRLNELKSRIRALGNVNVAAIEEYKEVAQRYEYMSVQIADVETSKTELNKLIRELTGQMKEMFVEKFTLINKHFGEMFQVLFGGGGAELKLTDPEDVLESGIEIIAQPPGKNISIIEQLSGGEKALIAVAIYFAIMKVNAPPFCLLDEVEAALDEVNVDRFAEQVRKMSDRTQFIIITHRRGTMEEADVLYGVTMQEKGVSKLLALNVSELTKNLEFGVK